MEKFQGFLMFVVAIPELSGLLRALWVGVPPGPPASPSVLGVLFGGAYSPQHFLQPGILSLGTGEGGSLSHAPN